MLVSLEEIAAMAPALEGLTAHPRLARLASAWPPTSGALPFAAVAAEIAGELASLAARADRSGLGMIAYLIGVAREEAEARSRAAT